MSETPDTQSDGPKPAGFRWQRLWPLAVIAAGFAAFFAFGLDQYVSLATLRENQADLKAWVAANALLAALLYIGAYILIVALSLPAGAVATLTGGFLFGTWAGGFYTVIGATIGATIIFLAAKTALGDYLRSKAGPALKRIEAGFNEGAFSYLLALRLIPAFPFFVVNLAPAFLGVPLRTYVITTFLGIIPGSLVYASVGNGLGSVFAAGENPDLGIIFEPQILFPILGLAALSLLPAVYRRVFRRAAPGDVKTEA